MSRAFVKEDVDPPERSRRTRNASGLPPGASNYITARGAQSLRDRLGELRRQSAPDKDRVHELEERLASLTVVEQGGEPGTVAFGARVTIRDAAGQLRSYHIVGVDELELYPDGVSWISPVGKALLAAEVGDRVVLDTDEQVEIVSAEFPVG